MSIKRGLIVQSAAGRDKGGFFIVLDFDGEYAIICDGKRRKLSNPKKKKSKHLVVTNTILSEDNMGNNSKIRKALNPFCV